jgi:hypothetical protein
LMVNIGRKSKTSSNSFFMGSGLQEFFSRGDAATPRLSSESRRAAAPLRENYISTGKPSRRMIFNAFVVGHGPDRSR